MISLEQMLNLYSIDLKSWIKVHPKYIHYFSTFILSAYTPYKWCTARSMNQILKTGDSLIQKYLYDIKDVIENKKDDCQKEILII